jgi:multisubunit Na+/H+ antiporter MnhG subunit
LYSIGNDAIWLEKALTALVRSNDWLNPVIRKGKNMQVAIRLILTGVLVYFVWRETGWATATAIGLIALGQEFTSYTIKKILE